MALRNRARRPEVQVALAAGAGAGVAWASAWVLRRQHQLVTELRAAQEALAESAAAAERARIAREVHDVVAHSLTVTLLHLSAARLAIQDRPGDAVAALAEAERLGRRSLADVRRAVGLLGPAAPPLPSGAEIEPLIDEYRAAGMDVTVTVSGDVAALSPATGLALYRIAEESLANAARHAPGAEVTVELRCAEGQAVLAVVNGAATGATPPTRNGTAGLGLTGMRQRAELVGGRLTVGPVAGGGWGVAVNVALAADGEAP